MMSIDAANAAPPSAPAPAPLDTPALLRAARGYSCLFWSLLLLAALQWLALRNWLPPPLMALLMPTAFLPLYVGLRRTTSSIPPAHHPLHALLLAGMLLSPFLAWWAASPWHPYFAINAAFLYAVTLALLTGLNGRAALFANTLAEPGLRREARAGQVLVLWPVICTLLALAIQLHRAGIGEAAPGAILEQVAALARRTALHFPRETAFLFLLPHAVTAYVLWRAKETAFRHAIRPPAAPAP